MVGQLLLHTRTHTQTVTGAGKDAGGLEPSFVAAGVVRQPLWKVVWQFPKKLDVELLYSPAALLLSLCPEELEPETKTVFPVARRWDTRVSTCR